jgi:hypothetical protein
VLGTVLDVVRLRQHFNAIARTKEIAPECAKSAGLVNDARRSVVTLPFERRRQPVPPEATLGPCPQIRQRPAS